VVGQEELDGIEVEDEEAVAQLLEIETGIEALKDEMRARMFTPKTALPFLNPGRLVRVLTQPPGAPSCRLRVPFGVCKDGRSLYCAMLLNLASFK
jgi:rRNA-processing arch domain